MQRKRVIVAFGDIIGFRCWIRRASNTHEIGKDLINNFYREFERFAAETGYHVKFLGDGMMIVRELKDGHNCGMVRRFLQEMNIFALRVQWCMQKYWPRPDGFRIRVVSGYVWKRMVAKRRYKKQYTCPEYIGYAINMAQGLLNIYPRTLCICDESIIEILGQKKGKVIFEQLPPPEDRRTGVDPEDLKGLRSFRFDDKNSKSD